ncbi:hypothetical protein [Yoonia sp. BS5-3]|uniref:SH3 domain-containing protein n=1 Tax=Yoonia phaeophyticola TaxID=3137369 RepID=A0ABZ2V8Z7_9RHOB
MTEKTNMKCVVTMFLSVICATAGLAEDRTYGSVYLSGLARVDTWPYNSPGVFSAMVCNVNGPDGFLSVRDGPGSEYEQVRAFNRLAILEVDTRDRIGNWVRVVSGSRTHTPAGYPQEYRALPVRGWAHDSYLCSFID